MTYRYLILDSKGRPVAHCTSFQGLDAPTWQLQVDPEDLECVMGHTSIRLVGTSDKYIAAEGQILRWNGHSVLVKAVRELDGNLRKNLRMPVRFPSFLYPITGKWQGRRPILSHDLSCGGIAFYCGQPLEEGEVAQLVVPVTAQPLLLSVTILHRNQSEEQVPLYGARFTDLVREEESMIREAVFNLQLHHPCSGS